MNQEARDVMMRLAMCVAVAGLVAVGACEQKSAKAPTPVANAAAFPSSLFLASAPAETKDVKDVKPTLKAGDKVALAGRVGGVKEPFVAGRAMFNLVDKRVPACSDNPEDTCKTPWDYCCESSEDLMASSATVEVLGADGQTIKSGLEGVHGLKPLSRVVVVGTVATAEKGNLIVKAEGIWVE
jgi:hypothetical protein